jgi:hypothetical protein
MAGKYLHRITMKALNFVVYKDTVAYGPLLRPIQVRGRTPESNNKPDDAQRGKGELKLSQRHPELVVVIPFMVHGSIVPTRTAYLPAVDNHVLNVNRNNGRLYTFPTKLVGGLPVPYERFERYFDESGIMLLDTPARMLFPSASILPSGVELIIDEQD